MIADFINSTPLLLRLFLVVFGSMLGVSLVVILCRHIAKKIYNAYLSRKACRRSKHRFSKANFGRFNYGVTEAPSMYTLSEKGKQADLRMGTDGNWYFPDGRSVTRFGLRYGNERIGWWTNFKKWRTHFVTPQPGDDEYWDYIADESKMKQMEADQIFELLQKHGEPEYNKNLTVDIGDGYVGKMPVLSGIKTMLTREQCQELVNNEIIDLPRMKDLFARKCRFINNQFVYN